MIKSEFIQNLSEKLTFLSSQEIESAVNLMFEEMAKSLVEGERIEIRGFGTFRIHQRPARFGYNPKTGERIMIPTRRWPYFKPGKEFKARVDYLR